MQEAGLGRYICEGAVAVIAVEFVLAIVRDEQIFKTVVVVISHTDAYPPPGIP